MEDTRSIDEIIKIDFIDLSSINIKLYLKSGKYLSFVISSDLILYPFDSINDININTSDIRYSESRELYRELLHSRSGELHDKNKVRQNIFIFIIQLVDKISKILCSKEKQLYFLQNSEGLIKIGVSNDVDRRVNTLENQLECDIYVIKCVPYPKYERILHRKFDKYNARYKNQVEWFTPYPELVRFIESVDENNFIDMVKKINI